MLFLGQSFLGERHSLDPTPVCIPNLNSIKLSDGIFDELFVSSNADYDLSSLEWGFSTILWAQFKGNLAGGNIEESLKDISAVLIKRRKKGSYKWITLFEIPVDDVDSLKFERFDRYVANNNEYEYALVFMLANIEVRIT